MKHLFEVWEKIVPMMKDRRLLLFLDYDGTLVPIAARPSMARFGPRLKRMLLALSKHPEVDVAVISGRLLKDVKKCVGIPGIVYAGNHGLELEGPGIRHVHPAAVEFQKLERALVRRLRLAFAFFPEMLIESKSFSVSVHYRQVPADKIEFVKMILLKAIGPYLGRFQAVLTEGKKVWEIRPPTEWNKGKIVLWLLARVRARAGSRVLPIYVGDDVTDEDAFRALKGRGITVKVTENTKSVSSAGCFLPGTRDVAQFIDRLYRLKAGEEAGE